MNSFEDYLFLNDNRIKSADQLNDDGVVALLTAIFREGSLPPGDYGLGSEYDPYRYMFGGCLQVGNSHNGAYQCALNMSSIALHKYARGFVR